MIVVNPKGVQDPPPPLPRPIHISVAHIEMSIFYNVNKMLTNHPRNTRPPQKTKPKKIF